MSSQWKLRQKPPHVASQAEPRATRETFSPGPSSLLPPLPELSRTLLCWMPPAVMVRESLVSGSAIPCINFFFSYHVSSPHAPLARTEKHFPASLSFDSQSVFGRGLTRS